MDYKPNGCGSSYWLAAWARVPRWMSPGWNCCCDVHDLHYVEQAPKGMADKVLIDCLTEIADKSPWWQRPGKYAMIKIVKFALSTPLSKRCYKEAGKKQYENRRLERVV